MERGLRACSFDNLDGWAEDDHGAALEAFRVSARFMLTKPYPERALSPSLAAMVEVAYQSLEDAAFNDPKGFFERYFVPMRFEKIGFLTGYFEPVLRASREKSSGFPVPLLRRPHDLVEVNDTNRPPNWPVDMRFGVMGEQGLQECADRAAIQSGALAEQGLELVWLADPVDAFFIHVQGSAKLDLDPSLAQDDPARFMRVTFDGKSGHDYTSLAKVLCERHNIKPQDMTADRLADHMRAMGDDVWSLLAENRSYIFFKEVEGLKADEGPVAAAKVPLLPGRSLAMDRTLHMFGTPVWCKSEAALPGVDTPLSRLLTVHDTGSAITGAARGDLFVGSGMEAGFVAGRIRHKTWFTMLHPKVAS